jgi:hypothetical protein
MKSEFTLCRGTDRARDSISQVAPVARRGIFYAHVQSWSSCLSRRIEKWFDEYVSTGCATLQQEEAITWAEERIRQFLEPRIGHGLGRPFEIEPGLAPVGFAQALEFDRLRNATRDEKPNKNIVWLVAEVSAGQGSSLLTKDHNDVNEHKATQWQGPRWLNVNLFDWNWRTPERGQTLIVRGSTVKLEEQLRQFTGLLDASTTQAEVALIQRALWRVLEQAFDRARTKATIATATIPSPKVPEPHSQVQMPPESAPPVETPDKKSRKPRRPNERYAAIYRVMQECDALWGPTTPKLDKETLEKLAAALDKARITVQKKWQVKNWKEGVDLCMELVKPYLNNVAERFGRTVT